MKFWGVTGTNGKTTTTWIAAEFINAAKGRRCGYVTTVEVNTGSRQFYTGYTTPPLNQLKEIFAEMEANGCTDCVMEVSSHAIHQHRTGDTVFSGGVFTNLSEDHLDYHKTMEAYFDVKLDFARQIAAAHPTTPDMGRRDLPPYVVCLDGGYGREMFNAVGNLAVNVIPVSSRSRESKSNSGVLVSFCKPKAQDGKFHCSTSTPDFDLSHLQLVGDYNKSNVLCAAALAEAAGVDHDAIQAVIPTLKPRWGRLEEVKVKGEGEGGGPRVFVDFAHTPDGLEKVLTAVRKEMFQASDTTHHAPSTKHQAPSTKHSLWVVFGAGGDRDPMKRPLMGAACAKLADRLVVTSDNPRSEDPMAIIGAILGGVENAVPDASSRRGADAGLPAPRGGDVSGTVFVEPDRKKAIEFALREAGEGDVVIIAGKGHETTQEVKGVKYPFDDREVVRNFRGRRDGVSAKYQP